MDKTVKYFMVNAKTGKVDEKKTKKLREMNKEFDSFMNVEKSARDDDRSIGKILGFPGALTKTANFVRAKLGNRDTQRAYRAARKAVKRMN